MGRRVLAVLLSGVFACIEVGEVDFVVDSLPESGGYVAADVGGLVTTRHFTELRRLESGRVKFVAPTDEGDQITVYVWTPEMLEPFLPADHSWETTPLTVDSGRVLLPPPASTFRGVRSGGQPIQLNPIDAAADEADLTAGWLPACESSLKESELLLQIGCGDRAYFPTLLPVLCGFDLEGKPTAGSRPTEKLSLRSAASAEEWKLTTEGVLTGCNVREPPSWAIADVSCAECDLSVGVVQQPELTSSERPILQSVFIDPIPVGFIGSPTVSGDRLFVPTSGTNTSTTCRLGGSVVIFDAETFERTGEVSTSGCISHLAGLPDDSTFVGASRGDLEFALTGLDRDANTIATGAVSLERPQQSWIMRFVPGMGALYLVIRTEDIPGQNRTSFETVVRIDPEDLSIDQRLQLPNGVSIRGVMFTEEQPVLLDDVADLLLYLDPVSLEVVDRIPLQDVPVSQPWLTDAAYHAGSQSFFVTQRTPGSPLLWQFRREPQLTRRLAISQADFLPDLVSPWPADPALMLLFGVPPESSDPLGYFALVDPVRGYVLPGFLPLELKEERYPLQAVVDQRREAVYFVALKDNKIIRVGAP